MQKSQKNVKQDIYTYYRKVQKQQIAVKKLNK